MVCLDVLAGAVAVASIVRAILESDVPVALQHTRLVSR
jgi:hypothetical protein